MQNIDQNTLVALDALTSESERHEMHDMIDIVGVIAGLKPAAFIGGNDAVSTQVIEYIERLGLKHVSWPEKRLLYISFDQQHVERLAALHRVVWGKNATFPDENREIGTLLGYPRTATEYFLKRLTSLSTGTPLPQYMPEGIEGTVRDNFYQLVLSPDNYQEEVRAYCEPLEATVREFAPKTHAALSQA